MKILVSLTYYTPNISGITIYVQRLVKGLTQASDKVTVLCAQHTPEQTLVEEHNRIQIIRVPITWQLGKGAIMLRYPWEALKLVRHHDVINAHLPQFEVMFIAILAKLYGKKLILTHHTDLSAWSGIINKISLIAVLFSQLIAGVLADKIIVYTTDYAKHSYYLQLFSNKLVQIYPPISAKPKSKYNFKPSSRYKIGFAGRIAQQKGIPYLLNAIPYLTKNLDKPFDIIFAGPDKEVIGENYQENIANLLHKYRNYLKFTGTIKPNEMHIFYNQLDLLVLPSDDRLESFGIVQVEAMLCGVPVVTTNLPGVRIPIRLTNMGELVPIKNSEALAEGITKVLTNRSQYVKKRAIIEAIFSDTDTIEHYRIIFSS